MQAFQLKEINTPLDQTETELEEGSNELVCKILYAGLNRRDHWIIKGLYPGIKLPAILGSDGLVEYQGDKYLINPNEDWGKNPIVPSNDYTIRGLEKQGTLAELCSVSKEKLFLKPSHLSDEEAATLPLGGLTAYRALISNCKVTKNDRVLINGVGGGVALLAFQMAVAIGAEVFVSTSNENKLERAIKLGAKGGANYREDNWGKNLKKEVGGFDVIIDSAGGDGFVQLIHACNKGARIGMYGGTRGTINGISPQHLFFKQIHIFGSTMGNDQEFENMIKFFDQYKIHPIVDRVYPFDQTNQAMERMLEKEKFGKVVVKIN